MPQTVNMSAPSIKRNTLIEVSKKVKIDSVSKYFILCEVICGLFRLPVLGVTKKYLVIMMFCLTVLFNILISYFMYPITMYHLARLFNYIEFLISTFLGNMLYRRLLNFYIAINRIDRDLNFKAQSHFIMQYVIYVFQLLIIGISLGLMLYLFTESQDIHIVYLFPIKLLHYLELNYYGHLFSLIIPRLNLLKGIASVCYNQEKPNSDLYFEADSEEFKKKQRKYSNYDVISLIDSYNNFIKAYDYLNSAIKWQMVITLTSTFVVGVNCSYHIAKLFLYDFEFGKIPVIFHAILLILKFMPLMVPCFYANKICNEIYELKAILTSKLYENRLDKDSRRAARTLLDLIETRPLYFSLLHMFNVDIALPFKILGLILTYLIILLQFDKIIYPNQVKINAI